VKISVVGFVRKSVVSVPDVWTVVPRAVYWSRSSSSMDSGGDRELIAVTPPFCGDVSYTRVFRSNCAETLVFLYGRFHLIFRIRRHITLSSGFSVLEFGAIGIPPPFRTPLS
jgi:hypothetical protein